VLIWTYKLDFHLHLLHFRSFWKKKLLAVIFKTQIHNPLLFSSLHTKTQLLFFSKWLLVANLDIQNSVMALVIKIKWAVTFNYNYATNIKPLCALEADILFVVLTI
jgi:hypothetical protein